MITADKAKKISEFNKDYDVDQEIKRLDAEIDYAAKTGKREVVRFYTEYARNGTGKKDIPALSPAARLKVTTAGYTITEELRLCYDLEPAVEIPHTIISW